VAKHVVAAAFQVSGTLLTRTWMRLRLLRGDWPDGEPRRRTAVNSTE